MSGPKTSKYTLTLEQRKRLEEEQRRWREREEEKRRFELEMQKKVLNMMRLDDEVKAVNSQIMELDNLRKESGYEMPWLSEIKESIVSIIETQNSLDNSSATISADVRNENVKIDLMLRTIAKLKSSCSEHISETKERYGRELETKIEAGFHLSFADIGNIKRKVNPVVKKINETLEEINDFCLSEPLKQQLNSIRTALAGITDQAYLKNYYAIVVRPFIKSCEDYVAIHDEHDELMIRYAMLAAECKVEPRIIPYTREAVEEVKTEIQLLEKRAAEQMEREYIKTALDEAMQELGYELIGDRVLEKRSGRRIQHELYSLDDGTAVDVTYSDNGQITMELGGLDQNDRQPDYQEAVQLVEDMKSFCVDYDILTQKLAERGIQSDRLSIMPPTVEFAQIINENDFSIRKKVTRFSVSNKTKKGTSTQRREI